MSLIPRSIPSFERRATALTVAAFPAVIVMTLWLLAQDILPYLTADQFPHVGTLLWFAPLYLFLGSIIAIPLCLVIGLPLWHVAIHAGRHDQRDAYRCGLIASGIIAVLVIAVMGRDLSYRNWYDVLPLFGGICLAGLVAARVAHRLGYPPT